MDVTRSVPFITAQGHIQHLHTSKTTYDTDDTQRFESGAWCHRLFFIFFFSENSVNGMWSKCCDSFFNEKGSSFCSSDLTPESQTLVGIKLRVSLNSWTIASKTSIRQFGRFISH